LTDNRDILEKAKKLVDNEDFEEGIEVLEDLFKKSSELEVKKSLIDALFAYGGYLNDYYVLEYEKAIKNFKRIIELDAHNYRAHYNLGIAYFNLELFEEALNACKIAIAIKPDYKHCHYNIGLIYEEKENLEKALEAHQKALKIDPEFIYAKQALMAIRQKLDNLNKTETESNENESVIERLKALLSVSKRIKADMIQELLKLNKETLIKVLIEWGQKYNFELDGDYLNINKELLPKLIDDLNRNGLGI
jgi:tetratricopeptide (TPR) repeat protein